MNRLMRPRSKWLCLAFVACLTAWARADAPLAAARSNPRSFSVGLAAGILMCLLGVQIQTMLRKSSHERELRRIALIDSPR